MEITSPKMTANQTPIINSYENDQEQEIEEKQNLFYNHIIKTSFKTNKKFTIFLLITVIIMLTTVIATSSIICNLFILSVYSILNYKLYYD